MTKKRRYCLPCEKVVPARQYECKDCGAETEPWPEDDPEREAYEQAQASAAWERRGGGGL